jgi:hypothetical protein
MGSIFFQGSFPPSNLGVDEFRCCQWFVIMQPKKNSKVDFFLIFFGGCAGRGPVNFSSGSSFDLPNEAYVLEPMCWKKEYDEHISIYLKIRMCHKLCLQ